MRGRIVIGAVVVVVISVAAYFLSLPKEGTVEWHKRRCEKEMLALGGQKTMLDRVRRELGFPPRKQRYYEHSQALMALGYLEERHFTLTNNPDNPSLVLFQWATNALPQDRLWGIGLVSNNVLMIRAERHSMKKWEEAVRRIDVPKKPE